MTDEDIAWLLDNADHELERVESRGLDSFAAATFLRKQVGEVRCESLMDLAKARKRAVSKFRLGETLFATQRSVQQATDELIATYKAARFHPFRTIADLCCGMGGDALALATMLNNKRQETSQLTLVDRCPLMCAFATANLARYALETENLRVICSDVEQARLSRVEAWHADPDRRSGTQRFAEPELCTPPLSTLFSIPALGPNAAIKLAPAADASHLLQQDIELEWVGHRGECQQQIAWSGKLAKHPGQRVATVLERKPVGTADHNSTEAVGQVQTIESSFSGHFITAHSYVGETNQATPHTTNIQTFLYEPFASVFAAGVSNSLAVELQLSRISQQAGYLTGNSKIDSPLLSRFRVVEELGFREKAIRKRIQHHGLRVTEVKKRGVKIDPAQLLRKFKDKKGSGSDCVLLLYPVGKAIRAVLALRE